MKIKKSKGCLYGIIENIDQKYINKVPKNFMYNQQNRDNNIYHITVINSHELNNFDYIDNEIDIDYINLGLSKLQKDEDETYYLYVISNKLISSK